MPPPPRDRSWFLQADETFPFLNCLPPPQVFLQSHCVYFLHLVWCHLGTFLWQITPPSSGTETLHHSQFCFNVWTGNIGFGSRSSKTLFPQLLPLVMCMNCRIPQKVDAMCSKSLGTNVPTWWDIQWNNGVPHIGPGTRNICTSKSSSMGRKLSF